MNAIVLTLKKIYTCIIIPVLVMKNKHYDKPKKRGQARQLVMEEHLIQNI